MLYSSANAARRAGHMKTSSGSLEDTSVLLFYEMVQAVAMDGMAAVAAHKAGVVRCKLVAHAMRTLAQILMETYVPCHGFGYLLVCSQSIAEPNKRRYQVVQDKLQGAVQVISDSIRRGPVAGVV